jgi:outer membrane protein TolC
MRSLFFTLCTIGLLQAQSIDTLISHAIKKHPSLEAIQQRLSQMDSKIAKSQNFSNPKLSLTINDIQFGDPLSRDLEPMQYQAINIQQTFPWFDKLDAKKSYAQAQKKVVLDSYEVAKVTLAKEIRLASFTLKELEVRLHILHTYKSIAKQNITLYNSYASTEETSHSNSLAASLLLAKLKIREQRYMAILKTQKSKLKYLSQVKVSSISNTFKIKKPHSLQYYLAKLSHNPSYQKTQSQTSVAHAQETLKDLAHTPDPYVKVGYFNRQEYNDYASISVGASFPIYGTEEKNSEIARMAVLEAKSQSIDYKYALINEIETLYITLNEAYKIYNIIQNESLPQLEHMFELSQSSIQNGADLFTYTSLLEQKLALEEERIAIKGSYLRTEAKLKSLIGEI